MRHNKGNPTRSKSPSNPLIVATGPTGFAGAGQILIQTLHELSRINCETVFVGAEIPYPMKSVRRGDIDVKLVTDVQSGAIGEGRAIRSQDILLSFSLAEKISTFVLDIPPEQHQQIVIWGTYLVPYGYAALLAKQMLKRLGLPCALWLTPTGSDIWEVGPQLYNVTRHLLFSPDVDSVFSYTESFSKEIIEKYSLNRLVESIFPMLDFERFHPVAEQARLAYRQTLGISESSFVICSHSNMRPVKHPDDVILVADAVAKELDRDVVLLMVGPEQKLEIEQTADNLLIMWPGIVADVERFLWVSDVELNLSSHDSFNLSLAEAMACGLPCISTNIVGIATEISKSKGGFLFEYSPRMRNTSIHSRYKDLIQQMLLLAKNDDLRQEVGTNASRHAFSVFNPNRILPKYTSMLASAGTPKT